MCVEHQDSSDISQTQTGSGEHRHGEGHASHGHGQGGAGGDVLTVRAMSGLSGDMMLTGLARMLGMSGTEQQRVLDELVDALDLPALRGCASLERRSVNSVAGWGCRVELPHEHAHRPLAEILRIIEASRLEPEARDFAAKAFALLAEAEGAVHDKPASEVCFHEVGALDSVLDICVVSALYARLAPVRFVCSPLPLADGGVRCAHGWLPVPAPAVLELLRGIPVRGFAGNGETVTPTALALLHALGAEFGPWPDMTVRERALVYGTRVFPGVPNGAIWALGHFHIENVELPVVHK